MKKKFFKLLDKALFGKTMENVRKHIKLVTTEARSNYLVSETKLSYIFFHNVLVLEIKKNKYSCMNLSVKVHQY